MNKTTAIGPEPCILELWRKLAASLDPENGQLSIRSDSTPEQSFALAQGLEYPSMKLNQAKELHEILKISTDHGFFRGVDAISMMRNCIIGTTTANCVERDKEIHRETGHFGDLLEVCRTTGYLENQTVEIDDYFRHHPSQTYDREPVDVIVHAPQTTLVRFEYEYSFTFDPATLPAIFSLAGKPDEDSEGPQTLVCDLHRGANGERSITITRNEMTPEGEMRRIIFSRLST